MAKLQVKKIQITIVPFDFKKLKFPLGTDEMKELISILPSPETKLSFELHNTNAKFVNGLRRCLIDELPLWSLTCKLENVKSNDHKIMVTSDCIVRQLNLIPLTQDAIDMNIFSKYDISINVSNKTTNTICITTSDIIIKTNTKHKEIIEASRFFSTKINICDLDRGYYIKINNITITKQKNFNTSIGSVIHSMQYIPIEYEEELEPNATKKLPSSLCTNPTKYCLGYSINGLTSALYPAKLACTEILARLKILHVIILKSNDIPFYSDEIYITHDGSFIEYKIYNESWTIGHLLSWYCYQIDSTIPYVAIKNEHMLTHTIILRIRHTDHKKIILLALNNISTDYEILLDAFKNIKK